MQGTVLFALCKSPGRCRSRKMYRTCDFIRLGRNVHSHVPGSANIQHQEFRTEAEGWWMEFAAIKIEKGNEFWGWASLRAGKSKSNEGEQQ